MLCIPGSLVKDVIINFHETLGHFGVYKTWVALRDKVHFPNMQRTIKKYIKACDICQKAKISILPKPPQKQIIPNGKDDLLAIDVLGPLVRSRAGVMYMLVIFNVFTKHVTLYPLRKATSRAMVNCLTKKYFPLHGQVMRILHDNATQFTSNLWKATFAALGIQLVFISVRHACANPSERCMREIARILRTFCHEHQSKWAVDLARFEEFLNSVVHEATGFTPNELQFGQERTRLIPTAVSLARTSPSLEQKLVLAEASLSSKAERRALRYPGRPYVKFVPGDLVLLKANSQSSALRAETKKLLLLFEGPFRIKKQIRDDTYVLQGVDGDRERGVFHASHLKKVAVKFCGDVFRVAYLWVVSEGLFSVRVLNIRPPAIRQRLTSCLPSTCNLKFEPVRIIDKLLGSGDVPPTSVFSVLNKTNSARIVVFLPRAPNPNNEPLRENVSSQSPVLVRTHNEAVVSFTRASKRPLVTTDLCVKVEWSFEVVTIHHEDLQHQGRGIKHWSTRAGFLELANTWPYELRRDKESN
ncbi:hypothetical protein NQ317_010245, partial [Molorchus minor]